MLKQHSTAFIFDYTLITDSDLKNYQKKIGDFEYEVIRLVKGVPIFFEAHFERLASTILSPNNALTLDLVQLTNSIIQLVKFSKLDDCNLRIDYLGNHILIYPIVSKYPSIKEKNEGVRVIFTSTERQDPTKKVYRKAWKTKIEQDLINADAYELLLVNNQGLITEGSKSNVFFIKNNELFSARPELILPGITNLLLLEIFKKLNIKHNYIDLHQDMIFHFDAAFLCGTSIDVLPIKMIDNQRFDTNNSLLKKLQDAFNQRFQEEYTAKVEKWKM